MNKNHIVTFGLKDAGGWEALFYGLVAVNERLAKLYHKKVIKAHIRFTNKITLGHHSAEWYESHVLLGTCEHTTSTITILTKGPWRRTYIHELIHLYNPEKTEAWVKKAEDEVIRLLQYEARSLPTKQELARTKGAENESL